LDVWIVGIVWVAWKLKFDMLISIATLSHHNVSHSAQDSRGEHVGVSQDMDEAVYTYLCEDLEATRRQLKLEQSNLRWRRNSLATGTQLTHWCLQVALIIYCINSYDWKLSVLWLKSPRRKGKPLDSEVSDDQLLQQLEAGFLAFDENELMSYLDPSSSTLSMSAIATAMKFTSEFLLAEKIFKMNRDHGKVLRPVQVVSEYNSVLDQTPGAGQIRRRNDHYATSTRCWAVRFRKRMH